MSVLHNLYQTYLASDKKNLVFIKALTNISDLDILNIPDENHETLLHHAAKNQDIDTVRLLLEKGVDVTVINKDRHTAIWYCLNQAMLNITLIGLLIIHGANVNEMDKECHSTLFSAVLNGDAKKVKQLLGLGADGNQTDLKLITPLKLILISLIKEIEIHLVIKDRNSLVNILIDNSPVICQDFSNLVIPEELFENVIVIGSTKFINSAEEYYSAQDSATETYNNQDTSNIAATSQSQEKKEFNPQQAIDSQTRHNHYVHRMMKGFKNAITNIDEFEEAILNGVKFDYKAIERATVNSSDVRVKALHVKVKQLLAQEAVANLYINKKSTEIHLQKYIAHFLAKHSLFPRPGDSLRIRSEATEKYQQSNRHEDLQELIESEEMIIIREEKAKHQENKKNIHGKRKV